ASSARPPPRLSCPHLSPSASSTAAWITNRSQIKRAHPPAPPICSMSKQKPFAAPVLYSLIPCLPSYRWESHNLSLQFPTFHLLSSVFQMIFRLSPPVLLSLSLLC